MNAAAATAHTLLDAQQLTGRSRTHVSEISEPRCTLHPRAAKAFVALRRQAAHAGIDLVAMSTFRDFERQRLIWNDKFHGRRPALDQSSQPLDLAPLDDAARIEAILWWSALPGASRHHWGTELDVYDRSALPGSPPQLVPSEYGAGGVFERLGTWLVQNTASCGFFLPYDRDRGGVQPEPWHISFAPISGNALRALTVDVLATALGQADVAGGATILKQLPKIHARYVCAVAEPSPLALAAAVNPAARPS